MPKLWRSPFLFAAIVALIAQALFIAPMHAWNSGGSGDTVPAELMPINILQFHSLDFNEFLAVHRSVANPAHLPYFFTLRNGKVVSFYPLVPGLMNLPAFMVADHFGYDLFRYRYIISHWSSSIICALAAGLMFLALDAICPRRRVAVAFALLFAGGTEVWSEASRAMWQHGPSILLFSGVLAILFRKWAWAIPLAGLLLGLAIWNRPTNVLIAGPVAVYIVIQYRRRIVGFLCGLGLPLLLMALYSYFYLGSVMYLGQGRSAAEDVAPGGMLRARLIPGLEGLIFSPNRGLLVFTPIFAFGLAYLVYATFSRRENPLYRYLFVGVLLMLYCYGHWYVWWGGWCFGYRLIAELTPILILATAMAWNCWLSHYRLARWPFYGLAAWSIYAHFLGAVYAHASGYNMTPDNIDTHTARLWDIKDGELSRDHALFVEDLKTILTGHWPKTETPEPIKSDVH